MFKFMAEEMDIITRERELYKKWFSMLSKVEDTFLDSESEEVIKSITNRLEEHIGIIVDVLAEAYERVSGLNDIRKAYVARGEYPMGDEYYEKVDEINFQWEEKCSTEGEQGVCQLFLIHNYCDADLRLPVAFMDMVIEAYPDIFGYVVNWDDKITKNEIEIL